MGAEVSVINDDFDGMDINVRCGSTHLEPLRALMAETGADVGIAHDGDADRVMLMAPDGTEIDGDMVEAVCALDMRERGVLAGDTVVSTVMCNFGFVRAMKEMGINVVQTKVGDRYVLEAMREHGYSIGGEQSGHMILLDHNSTGDGLMTACQFLAAVIRSGKPVAEAIQVMEKMPQTLINVRVNDKHAVEDSAEVAAAVASAEEALGEDGRVLLRPSGTEPVVRVMVAAVDPAAAPAHPEMVRASALFLTKAGLNWHFHPSAASPSCQSGIELAFSWEISKMTLLVGIVRLARLCSSISEQLIDFALATEHDIAVNLGLFTRSHRYTVVISW